MKPVLFAAACAATAAALAAAAWADSMKDASFEVTPGQYHWQQNTSVAGIPISEDNTECLTEKKASMTLSGLARDLDKSCTVDEVAQTADGYTFKLICTGKIPGTARAQLVHSDRSMTITAKGNAKVLGIPAGFSVKADATYVGACTPDQLAHAAEKEAKEAAKGG
ncbi:MAG: DUF3617 family protein [Alphaproteobacteria bacterium]|nr:DUF3617 family protein [Alphaproteobacteria bacterium]